jgi:hypothetical protein
MATIRKKSDDVRHGAVKGREQVYNPTMNRFIKVDSATGRFMDVKDDAMPFAGVRKSKATKKKAAADKKADARKAGKKKAKRKASKR